VSEDRGRRSRSQHVGVVDALGAGDQHLEKGHHLGSGLEVAGAVAQVDDLVGSCSMPRCVARVAGRMSPALATEWASSKLTSSRSRLRESGIEKVSHVLGRLLGWYRQLPQLQQHLSVFMPLNTSYIHYLTVDPG
jgi:hypothetical protein